VVNKLIVSNILHRPIRTVVSVLAVAIEVGMVMLVVGMTHGLLDDAARRVEGVGADVMVQPPGSSFMFGLTSAPMSVKLADRLAEIPRVQAVTPVLFQTNLSGGLNLIYGINLTSFDRVTGGFAYHAGAPFTGPYDVMVDDLYARANHVKVGQTLNFLNHDFRVCAIVEHGKGSRIFIPLETIQDLAGSRDKATVFFVKCTDPGYVDDVVSAIHQLLPKHNVLSVREWMSLMTSNNLPALDAFVTSLISVAVAIGFLVIFLSMYTTITERTREIGILKSLGASKGYIMGIILREACMLCAVGIVGGYGGTLFAKRVILAKFPTLSVELTPEWWLWAALLALAGTLMGASYPALRAARLDPVDALAYE
jgi:putative ABC transport system permease protein